MNKNDPKDKFAREDERRSPAPDPSGGDTRPGINMPADTKEAGFGSDPQSGDENAGQGAA